MRISPMMRLALCVLLTVTSSAFAALEAGNKAPMFDLRGALAGQEFDFDLASALKQGPVVVYFYPKAFTPGCTIEAHAFAEASDDFAALGSKVVGISTDNIGAVKEFSVSECRNKFAVLADPNGDVVAQYQAKMPNIGYAKRVSYVIVPSGEIIYVHETAEPKSHIRESLAAIKRWRSNTNH